MSRIPIILLTALVILLCVPFAATAGPDKYCGDTSIYGGSPSVVEPNVLVFIDDSGSMADTVPGGIYDPSVVYPVTNNCISSTGTPGQPCLTNAVYTSSYNFFNADVNNITTSCGGANPRNLLLTTGQYNGRRLNTSGTCRTGTGNYVLGNYANWRYGPGAPKRKIDVARDVVSKLIMSTHGMRFGLMRFHYVAGSGEGSEFMNINYQGQPFTTTISTMTTTITGTYTKRNALVAAVNVLTPRNNTPLGESLFEILRYFQGGATAFGNAVGVDASGNYTSPIEYGCQKNYVIFVTDGMSNADTSNALRSICNNGDCDGDGREPTDLNHTLDDVAHYMYYNDLRPDAGTNGLPGEQNVTTYTIGFGLGGSNAAAVALLQRAADQSHGHGNYYDANSESDLSLAFTSIVTEIFSVNTSFVAPVVPVSPENRTYSGSRVYMGFFKPDAGPFWTGNLKKFGLDDSNNLTDIGGRPATYVDRDGDRRDDRDGAIVPVGSVDGSFRNSSQSYWSIVNDGGEVDLGGVGDLLLTRVAPRNIYTYLGPSADLTAPTNAFNNTNITETAMGFTAGDTGSRDDLINYVYGLDPYDEDGNGIVDERRPWILGDILHSRPQIVAYNTYTVATDETNCSVNRTRIFVGGNDGMLHAFRDCDGSEEWAFVPPDLLSVLRHLRPGAGAAHTYFVDYSPTVYVFNRNKDGTINPANGDMVILLFGLRRGGGLDTGPTKGYIYAINVTDPSNPIFLWKKSSSDALYAELGEAWSDISIGKIRVGAAKKVALFMGAGYDNCNEDARFGRTQTYLGSCVSIPTADVGATVSGGATTASALTNAKGRGIYIIELAELNSSDVPVLTASAPQIWKYTNAENPTGMVYSIPGRLKMIDINYDGFIDRLYAGDMGGNLWRFNINNTNTANWSANKIFSANPGYTLGAADGSQGRKIFYEPSAFPQADGTVRLYFGSGDREHPLNTSIVDRMYGLIDRNQTTGMGITEANLVDVTEDRLQDPSATQAEIDSLVSELTSTMKFGWYIRLNLHAGEKVLSPALAFNKNVIYTTYSPETLASTDPCATGNLGTSRIYVVNYQFGTAAVNFDVSNDAAATANLWTRTAGSDYNLMRSDREKALGGGIPSGAVMVISKTGQTTMMIGVGGNVAGVGGVPGGVSHPLSWRQMIEHP